MEHQKKLRFGVIGTGEFVQSCHVPGLQSHPQAEVVALCGSDYRRVRSVADRLRVPDVYTDYVELCSREDIDGITIATANALHARQAITALSQKKHVLCEKPLALNLREAEQMVSAAEASGSVHQVAFTFRYGYAVRELRRRVGQGDIGEPYYLRVQYDGWKGLLHDWKASWREKLEMSGGGILYELGVHLFDIARFVLGPIEMVTGFLHNVPRLRNHCFENVPTRVETDDIAAAWFRHKSGVRGQFFISRATPSHTDNGFLEVIGPEGALKAGLSRGKVDVLKVSRPERPEWEELPLPNEARDGKPHSLGIMMRSFVDACLRGKLDETVDASFVDGLAAQQALSAVVEANKRLTWLTLDRVAKSCNEALATPSALMS